MSHFNQYLFGSQNIHVIHGNSPHDGGWSNFAVIVTGFAQMQKWSKVKKAAYTKILLKNNFCTTQTRNIILFHFRPMQLLQKVHRVGSAFPLCFILGKSEVKGKCIKVSESEIVLMIIVKRLLTLLGSRFCPMI